MFFPQISQAKEAAKSLGQLSQDKDPVYSTEEVSQHNSHEKGIWVTYKGNVYDITDFVANHPGGSEKIILAAGGALEPFWALYAVHNNEHVLELLAEYRIGSLSKDESSIEAVDIKVCRKYVEGYMNLNLTQPMSKKLHTFFPVVN